MARAIHAAIPQMVHYPDPDCTELIKTLAGYLHLAPEHIITGNGAVELIYLLVKVLQPKKVLLPQPTFGEYEIAVVTGGGTVMDYPLSAEKGFHFSADEITALLPGVQMVMLCNPNNPTGTLLNKDEMIRVLQAAKSQDIMVVVDEAFIDFVAERDKYSTVSLLRDFPNLFILYSLTKFFAIPGLRLGAAMGSQELVKQLKTYKDPWNVNCFAQVAGVVSLQDEEHIQRSIAYIQQEKQFLFEQLGRIAGFKSFPPTVNYIFIDIRGTGCTAAELTDRLGRRGILIRDCSSYKNLDPYYIRVAVRSRAENQRLLAALSVIGSE